MKVKSNGHGGRLSRLAYRWVKGVAGWSRSTVGPVGTNIAFQRLILAIGQTKFKSPKGYTADTALGRWWHPARTRGEVDAIASTWAQLWQTYREYAPIDFHGIEDERLEPLTVDDLLSAAATFPVNTGLGVDNFSPRAVTRLPHVLIQQLADILKQGRVARGMGRGARAGYHRASP